MRVGLVECRDGPVFGIHINEHVQDFTFFKFELVLVAREQYAPSGFQFQVVALGGDAFDACAVEFSDFHDKPFRSGVTKI